MRTLPVLLALGACLLLTGCDWWHSTPPRPVTVTCNCQQPSREPATAAPPPAAQRESERTSRTATTTATVRTRHARRHYAAVRRHHYYRGSRRYLWNKRKAEASIDIYGYSNNSHVSSSQAGHASDAYGYAAGGEAQSAQGGACCGGQGPFRPHYGSTTRVWVDGFGRRHIYDESAVRHYVYEAHQRQARAAERLDPWHGYSDGWDQ